MNLQRLANSLTLIRATFGIPILIALANQCFYIAWLLILLGGLSDFADGWLARKSGGGTTWGARLDPLSDKILITAPFIWLASEGVVPIWATWLLITRDLLISGWRSQDKEGGPASLVGKSKTTLQFTSILLLIWPISWGGALFTSSLQGLGLWLFWASLFLAITSAYKYFKP